ncbi:MAG: hypothetical protein A2431_03225 [Candidatus Zambryskibacteria bacterium RIFOXYC1_FULL_39_10]|uniref:Uncharacterized protein n=1 Tax=Candidatus Zambryskibacteria bacterium RIFOXYC1_FULL_39_10 TaxID=1802779 RepID=A0A1G2V0N7_9BACT|nr:MAG: hypothetical protein A2431_03225 [Candidatus Zambryskibacteria bacterium RIFOXYC1_FULL_39_10]OHB16245.1 MAG: hypothetical protein A2605_01375 [Candidatus Zambryskibacteria bacterium RIFOXYD1_FULL_39_35]
MSATFFKINNKRGITLIETILYMVILTFFMGIIVQMLVSIGTIYKEIKVTRELESSGTIAMERMLKEIRNASRVTTDESILETSPGKLTVSGVDENSEPYKISFEVLDNAVQISKNIEAPVALTSSSGAVSYLTFHRVTNDNSEGVRIVLEMSGSSGANQKTEIFYGFAVLRGSY